MIIDLFKIVPILFSATVLWTSPQGSLKMVLQLLRAPRIKVA